MLQDHRSSKVEILIQQKRYSEASKIVSDLLSEDPTDIQNLALFAEILNQQGFHEKAHKVIDSAIGLGPDYPTLFYIKASIFADENKLQGAEKMIHQAIQIDPHDADFFGFLAQIYLIKKQFQKALDYADEALALDPENISALNSRSTALQKLKRKQESFETIEGALREDPNNAFTHANYGWGLLEQGEHKKALEHFKESLKHDPTFSYAQSGILEALKAKNPIYRLFLKYAFFMGNLSTNYQWGFILGIYFATRILNSIAKSNEEIQPFITPIVVVLSVFAFSTWIIRPISNLFLRFNVYGKLLLDRKEKLSSSFVAITLGASLIGLLFYFVLDDERFLSVAAIGAALMLPLGIVFEPTKQKNTLPITVSILVLIGIGAIIQTFISGELMNYLSTLFLFSFIGFQWVANFLMLKDE